MEQTQGHSSQKQVEQWAFPVDTVPVYAANRAISPLRAIVRGDDGAVLGVVGRSYQVITHGQLVSVVDQAFDKLGYRYSRTVDLTKGGARLYGSYTFPFVVEDVSVGDAVALRLLLRNAYDGTAKVGFNVGALRLVCNNGLTSFSDWWGLSSKHTGGLDLDGLMASVGRVFSGYRERVLPFWRELASRSISNEQAKQFVAEACGREDDEVVTIPQFSDESWFPRKYHDGVWQQWATPANNVASERARSAWVLMNAFLFVVTHEIQPKSLENALRLKQRTEAAFRSLLRN